MTDTERKGWCIQQLINVLSDARRALPDTLEYTQSDEALLRRYEQCKRLDEALRELQLGLEDDRDFYDKLAMKEAEHGEKD